MNIQEELQGGSNYCGICLSGFFKLDAIPFLSTMMPYIWALATSVLRFSTTVYHHKRSAFMKRNHFLLAPLALGLALGSLQFTPTLQAQSQSQPDTQHDQQKKQTFVGKIIKARNGQYALLTDETAGKGVLLDDQEKAKTFEGKNVKVTGVLEVAKNLIHVTDIEPA